MYWWQNCIFNGRGTSWITWSRIRILTLSNWGRSGFEFFDWSRISIWNVSQGRTKGNTQFCLQNTFGWQVYENWWQTFSNCLDNWVLGVSLSKSPFFLTYLLILKILSVLLKNSKGVIYVGVISLIRDSFFKMITHQPLLYPFRLCFWKWTMEWKTEEYKFKR